MLKQIPRTAWIVATACLLVMGLAGILALYAQLSRVSELDVLHSFQQAVEQAAINLSDRMAFSEETMRSLLYDKRLQDSLGRSETEETPENQLKEIKDLREMVYLAEKSPGIALVRVYLSDVKMITREGINFFGLSKALTIPEYDQVLSGKGFLVWMGAHEVKTTYFQDTCLTLGCLYRAYFPAANRNNWGLVLLDLSEDYFAEVLSALELPDENARVVITDRDGMVVFGQSDPETLASLLTLDGPSGFHQAPDGEALAYVTAALSSADWSITTYMPRASLLNSRQTLRTTLTLLLFGLTLLMITVIVGILYALYARGVRDYIHAMNESLKATGETSSPPPAQRALLNLDRNIAELLDTNQRLAEETYRAQLREREVTLQALQAQINPHFLYNTLDSINWMAIREGALNVSDVIATLAEYFRLSLSRGRSVVTLREDIEIAEKYLSLYQNRYDFQYQVEWAADKAALDCRLPKLTLQPLIENALQHGIFKRAEKQGGILRITASLQDGTMTLAVRDNGPGLLAPESTHKGYGLTNVRERLEVYFGGQYTMTIENAPGGGAQAIVCVTAAAAGEQTTR